MYLGCGSVGSRRSCKSVEVSCPHRGCIHGEIDAASDTAATKMLPRVVSRFSVAAFLVPHLPYPFSRLLRAVYSEVASRKSVDERMSAPWKIH